MSWQDDNDSRKLSAAPYPGGGREPRFDVPPRDRRPDDDEDEVPVRVTPSEPREPTPREPIQQEPVQREQVQREPVSREPAQRESARREPGQREPMQRQATEREPATRQSAWAAGAGGPRDGRAEDDDEMRAALDTSQVEIAELKDKVLRATAEVENFRRRAEKERDDVAKYAISNFAREMLPVADNLRRALDSQPALTGDAAAAVKTFVTGVELTERELLSAFERFGLTRIDPLGQPFDHNLHQAMFEVEDANQPAGTVVQVMQPGYVLKERLLRPALVGVSKGGAARDTETREADTGAGDE